MPFMHSAIIALTITLILLLALQIARKKGTTWHAIRGILTAGAAMALVALVVSLSLKIGFRWTWLVGAHIAIGTGFFYYLILTVITGAQQFTGRRPKNKKPHRYAARMVVLFAVFTFASAFLARSESGRTMVVALVLLFLIAYVLRKARDVTYATTPIQPGVHYGRQ